MNPFAAPQANGAAPYPASTFNRSVLPTPQASTASGAGAPTVKRQQVALIVAIFAVAAIVLFHWHFNA